jgi:methionyl-tRNA formyltransferase
VIEATGDRLVISTSDGSLAIRDLQPAGKRLLSAEELLRGYPVRAGERFGPEKDD